MTNSLARKTPKVAMPIFLLLSMVAALSFPARLSAQTTAGFVKLDATTQGSWKTAYGTDGYNIIGSGVSYPTYVAPVITGNSSYTWASTTTDIRALQQPGSAQRIAATWYTYNTMTVDLAFSDGITHQLAVYCLDWDALGRGQLMEVLDANNAVLDTRSLTNFSGGTWLVWNVSGHVRLRVTLTAGANAVINGLFFAPAPLAVVSVSPNSNSLPTPTQTFQVKTWNPSGATNTDLVQVSFDYAVELAGGCWINYYPATNYLYLVSDNGNGFAGSGQLGTGTAVQNNQCQVNLQTSNVAIAGGLLTLNLALTFKPQYMGQQNIYVWAHDAITGQQVGGTPVGSWTAYTAMPQGPAAVALSPANDSGMGQIFTVSASSVNGYAYLTWMSLLIVNDINAATGGNCNVWYRWASNAVILIDDSGNWPGQQLGQPGVLSNSRCQLDVGASSVVLQGQTITLKLAITFKPVFVGMKRAYEDVSDRHQELYWPQVGAYTISNQLSVLWVTPNSTAAPVTSQTFQLKTWNPNGVGNTDLVQVAFDYSVDSSGACWANYYPPSNYLFLVSDNGTGFAGSGQLGEARVLQNSQCRIDLQTSSATLAGGLTTLNLAVTFTPQYMGQQNIYVFAHDSVTNQQVGGTPIGTWTAYTALPQGPAAGALSPANDSGMGQIFTVSASSVNGYAYLTWMSLLFVNDINAATGGNCNVWYRRASNAVILIDDSGNWPGQQLGQPGVLSNSRCQLDVGASSVVLQGQTITLKLAITFKPVFVGMKRAYEDVSDRHQELYWPQVGAYTVVPPFDFSLSAQAPPPVVAGRSTTAAVTITALSGTGPVTFNWANQPLWPAGLTANFSSNPASPGTMSIVVFTTTSTPAGAYTLAFTGTSGNAMHSSSVSVTVAGALSAYCGPSPNPVGVHQSTTISPYLYGGQPPFTYNWNGAASGTGSTVTYTPQTTPLLGYVTESLTVRDSLGQSANASCIVPVAGGLDFGLNSPSATITAGGSTAVSEIVTPSGGFNAPVTFSWNTQSWPAGLTASFNPSSTYSATSISLSAASSTPAGRYTLTFTGASGSIVHSGTLTVTVNGAADFGLSAWPTVQKVAPGSGAAVVGIITPINGFNSLVSLTWDQSSWPSGLTASFGTNPSGGSTTFLINTTSSTATGTYQLRYTASGGGRTHAGAVQVVVGYGVLDDTIKCAATQHWTDTRIFVSPTGHHTAQARGWSEGEYAGYFSQYLQPVWLNRGSVSVQYWPQSAGSTGVSPTSVAFEDFDENYSGGGTYYLSATYHADSPFCAQAGVVLSDFSDSFQLSVPRVTRVTPDGGVSPGGTIDVFGQGFTGIVRVDNVQISDGVRVSSISVLDDTHMQIVIDSSSPTSSSSARTVTLTAPNRNYVTLGDLGDPASLTKGPEDSPESTQFSIYVVDGTPVITSVQLSTPLYAGDPHGADVVIDGHNFGQNTGTLAFCATSSSNDQCNIREIRYDVSTITWNPVAAQPGLYEIRAHLTADAGISGDYYVQVRAVSGRSGQNFQPSPTGQTRPQSVPSGPLPISGPTSVKLIQFGWGGTTQELWKASDFTSNGVSLIGPIIWKDPNGDGNITVDDPVALLAGSNDNYLSDIILRTATPISATAQLQVVATPNDFTFNAVTVTFVNGQATLSNLNLASSVPNMILNKTYDFQWSIRFSTDLAFQPFRTTTHQVYSMHSLITNRPDLYRITTKRLDYVTAIVTGERDLVPIAGKLIPSLRAKVPPRPNYHILTPENVWTAFDGLGQDEYGNPIPGLDCESLSAIAAAELQQLGFAFVTVKKAYATGAESENTDATEPEFRFQNGITYTLGFAGNVFEGFVYVTAPNASPPIAFTVDPDSNGPLGFTGCTVDPSGNDPKGVLNRISFRVLTSTYRLNQPRINFQQWTFINRERVLFELPDQILLPRNGCPPEEGLYD